VTKAQYQVYNRLARKQVNRRFDVQIVEESISSCTFRTAFPALYLTYDPAGRLLFSETETERRAGNKRVVQPGQLHVALSGELGSADYRPKPVEVDDDDVPF